MHIYAFHQTLKIADQVSFNFSSIAFDIYPILTHFTNPYKLYIPYHILYATIGQHIV